MTSKAAHAWTWSREHSPLIRLTRWLAARLRPHARTAAYLEASDLPEPFRQHINQIVRRTRLWSEERLDIARELTSHAREAAERGQPIEDIRDSLGDPRPTARLLRRATRRKRSWFWQTRHRLRQAAAGAFVLLFCFYAVLFIRFNTASPTVRWDFYERINARNSQIPVEQHAYPDMEPLIRAWSVEFNRLVMKEADVNNQERTAEPEYEPPVWAHTTMPVTTPNQTGLADLLAFRQQSRPLIDQAITALDRPTLGVLYSDRLEEIEHEDGFRTYTMLPPSPEPRSAESSIGTLLPWLGRLRSVSRIIAFDASQYANEGRPDESLRSLTAVFRIAELTSQESTLIASLVAIAVQDLAQVTALHILHDHPDLFNEQQLAALSHTIARAGRASTNPDLDTEMLFFEEFMQRAYTDNGQGDGHLTAAGWRALREIGSSATDFGVAEDPAAETLQTLSKLTGPMSITLHASRREQTDAYRRIIAETHAVLATHPSDLYRIGGLGKNSPLAPKELVDRSPAMDALLPAFTKVAESTFLSRARTDASLVATACHAYRLRHSRWPASLDELSPDLLLAIPQDPFAPGEPIKYLVRDGQPFIYYNGANGTDQQATPPSPDALPTVRSLSVRYPTDPDPRIQNRLAPPRLRDSTTNADWIIYPPAD
jgi:hypothetical protein